MATIGPSIHDTDILSKLLEAGMAAGRVDLTWGERHSLEDVLITGPGAVSVSRACQEVLHSHIATHKQAAEAIPMPGIMKVMSTLPQVPGHQLAMLCLCIHTAHRTPHCTCLHSSVCAAASLNGCHISIHDPTYV